MADRADQWDDKEIGRPCVRRLGDAYWMWYAGCDSRFERAIGLAHSADGVVWRRFGPGPVLRPPARRLQPGYHSFANPCVLDRGDRFWLVVTAQGERARADLVASESHDGVTWANPRLLATGPTAAGFGAPSAVAAGDAVHLFVPVLDVDAAGQVRGVAIQHAVAADAALGVWEWGPDWPQADVDYPCALVENGRFVLWFSRYRDGAWAIERAESADGASWTEPEIVIAPGAAGGLDAAGALGPCALPEAGGYTMWRLGSSRSSDGYRGFVMRSRSPDGRRWTVDPAAPVFRPSYGAYLNPF